MMSEEDEDWTVRERRLLRTLRQEMADREAKLRLGVLIGFILFATVGVMWAVIPGKAQSIQPVGSR